MRFSEVYAVAKIIPVELTPGECDFTRWVFSDGQVADHFDPDCACIWWASEKEARKQMISRKYKTVFLKASERAMLQADIKRFQREQRRLAKLQERARQYRDMQRVEK